MSPWQKGISQKAWPEAKIWRHSSSVPNCHHNGEREAAWPVILLTRRGPGVILPLSLIQSHGRIHCSRYISRLRTKTKEDERQKQTKGSSTCWFSFRTPVEKMTYLDNQKKLENNQHTTENMFPWGTRPLHHLKFRCVAKIAGGCKCRYPQSYIYIAVVHGDGISV